MLTSRRGVTLIELAVCLAILAIAASLVVPSLTSLGGGRPRETAQEWLDLLRYARRLAIDSNVTVAVVLNPESGDYRIDSTGVGGAGAVETGQIDMLVMEAFRTDAPRLRYFFRPSGSAIGDTARVMGADSAVVTWVDPWNGLPHAGNLYLYDPVLFPR